MRLAYSCLTLKVRDGGIICTGISEELPVAAGIRPDLTPYYKLDIRALGSKLSKTFTPVFS